MQNEIETKLHNLLSVPLERECEVVYLLVEIRKFLGLVFRHFAQEKQSFQVLRMFCDWVVHTELTRYGKGSVLEFLDKALIAEERSKKPQKEVFDILAFKPLHDELENFLQKNGLPINIVDEPAQWGRLLKLYVNIVSECPLVFDKKNYPFKQMKKATLVFHELPDIPDLAGSLCVAWEWKLELRDGTTHSRSCTYGCAK